MKPPRLPTPEERKLWRESNKHTLQSRNVDESEVTTDGNTSSELAKSRSDLPPPGGGRLGGGPNEASSQPKPPQPNSPPPQPSPSGGGPLALRAVPALNPLTTREANRRFRSYPVDATLDLHGLTKLEALAKVQQFVRHQHAAHRRHVQIITGKGKGSEVGVLRKHLPEWLNEPALRPLISAFAHARPEKGGTGVLHVLLKSR